MDLITDLKGWKTDLDALGIEKGKAEGRMEQALSDLKSLGFDSIERAKEELDRLEKELAAAELEARELLTQFKEKYAGFIEP